MYRPRNAFCVFTNAYYADIEMIFHDPDSGHRLDRKKPMLRACPALDAGMKPA